MAGSDFASAYLLEEFRDPSREIDLSAFRTSLHGNVFANYSPALVGADKVTRQDGILHLLTAANTMDELARVASAHA